LTRTQIINQAIHMATAIRQSSPFYSHFNLPNSSLRPLIELLRKDEFTHPPKLGLKDLEREIKAVIDNHAIRSRKYKPVFEFVLRNWPREDDSVHLPPPVPARPLVSTPPLVPSLIPPKTVVAFPPPPTKRPPPIPGPITAKTQSPLVVAPGPFPPKPTKQPPPIPGPVTAKTQSPFVVAPVKPPSLPSVQTQAQDVAKSIQAVTDHLAKRSSEVSQQLHRVRLPSKDAPDQWLFRSLGSGQEPEKVLKEGLTYMRGERKGWDPKKYLMCMCCYADAEVIGIDGYMDAWVRYAHNQLDVPYLASGNIPDDSQGGRGTGWQYAIDTTAMKLSQATLITEQVANQLGITLEVLAGLKAAERNSLGRTDLFGSFCLSKKVKIRHDPEFKRIVVITYNLKGSVGEIDFIGKIEPEFVKYWLVIEDPGNETRNGSSQFMKFDVATVALYKRLNGGSLQLNH
jgi:hypothetical protein